MSLTCRPLSQAEFASYRTEGLRELAQALSDARDLSKEDALEAAVKSFESLFPGGRVESPDQYLSYLYDGETRVGALLFGIRRDRTLPYVYLWDIKIDPTHRGKGYGCAALQLLEDETRRLGLKEIRLNVFGSNQPARALYDKAGYRPESLVLTKSLTY